ncbi:uncharacterized protein LOC141599332 [Silene latifolia]|uniref:uncharacterized protein LOC141599332 n=1 Tax=Silene latifolia TaxID=37657 RepID=UPI003D76F3D9
MSYNASKPYLDEEATSKKSSQACQPSWMAHWTRKNSEVAPRVNEPSSLFKNKGKVVDLDGTSDFSLTTLNMANGFSKYGKGVMGDSKKLGHFKCEISEINQEVGDKNLSLALALGRGETSNETQFVSNKGLFLSKPSKNHENLALFPPPPRRSENEDTKRPLVVFERHFSNDNFTCLTKESCKYQKYSSFLVHETGMKNDGISNELKHTEGLDPQQSRFGKKNFTALFGEKHSNGIPNYTGLSDIDTARNVETMRICTVVDSIENSPSGNHKIRQRAHHVLVTKETCANFPSHCEEKTFGPFNASHRVHNSRPSGVKIQPLWTSTDSEDQENTGNSSVFKAGSKNDVSVEANSMPEHTCRNEVSMEANSMKEIEAQSRDNVSGRTSSLLHKDNTMDENNSPEKSSSKRLLLEIPDINEDIRGIQPAVSSTDEDEPSTSRVHSLNAKHLFSNKKRGLNQTRSETEDPSVSMDPSNRWIKRLKLSSADTTGVATKSSNGESSSPQKFNMFFNRIMKCNNESSDLNLNKNHGKDHKESTVSGCSWIKRWCQNSSSAPGPQPRPRTGSEPVVICEPHSLTFGQDEAAKKQFPSIGALALMGKAMNGYQTCEFSKKGSVVVWNTREF